MTRPLGPLALLPNELRGTSAPWTIAGPRDDDVALVFSRDNSTVDITPDEALAYARLFCAAPSMLAALQAVLLFHDAGVWSGERQEEWRRLTGSIGATTKSLCDTVRAAVAKATGAAP